MNEEKTKFSITVRINTGNYESITIQASEQSDRGLLYCELLDTLAEINDGITSSPQDNPKKISLSIWEKIFKQIRYKHYETIDFYKLATDGGNNLSNDLVDKLLKPTDILYVTDAVERLDKLGLTRKDIYIILQERSKYKKSAYINKYTKIPIATIRRIIMTMKKLEYDLLIKSHLGVITAPDTGDSKNAE